MRKFTQNFLFKMRIDYPFITKLFSELSKMSLNENEKNFKNHLQFLYVSRTFFHINILSADEIYYIPFSQLLLFCSKVFEILLIRTFVYTFRFCFFFISWPFFLVYFTALLFPSHSFLSLFIFYACQDSRLFRTN